MPRLPITKEQAKKRFLEYLEYLNLNGIKTLIFTYNFPFQVIDDDEIQKKIKSWLDHLIKEYDPKDKNIHPFAESLISYLKIFLK